MIVVNPNSRLPGPIPAIEPPLWASLIAAYHHAPMLDAEGLGMTLEQTKKAIRASGEREVLIVVMGHNPSVSSTPKMAVSEALADRLSGLDVSLTGIHPIAAGSKYPVIAKPFEGTPSIEWHKLPMDRYRAHNWHCLDGSPRSPYGVLYTSLGCPFDCFYCNIHTIHLGRQVVFRPIPDILGEVATLVKDYGVFNIKVWDELFALREDRVVEICKGLADYPLNAWAYARLDTVTPRMLRSMKWGGINWVAYGFENVRDHKFISYTEQVVRETRQAGLSIIANFMFGLPGTTAEDDRASVDFAKRHLFEYVNFYDARPYPGSQWYQELEKKSTDWDAYGQYRNISPFREAAFVEYFSNPAYLDMLRRKWGQPAVEHIESLVEHWSTVVVQGDLRTVV